MRRAISALAGAMVLAVLPAFPAAAHDGDHAGPGSAGPDRHSANVKLLSNSPKPTSATQSDLAFFGRNAVAANYAGFRILDVSDPAAPQVVTDFRCNGGQGDVSVMGTLLFASVDTPQSSAACDSRNVTASTPGMFEGIRVFDITDVSAPVHVASIETDCGSHTHTLLPEPEKDRAVLYVSSYPLGRNAIGPRCQSQDATTGEGGHSKVSVVEVPLADPAGARVLPYALDDDTQWATYFGFTLRACHDISVFKELNRAAAACMSEAQMWDISDPLAPRFLWRYDNPAVKPENVDLFHSASFSWDGRVVAFGDESGGGGSARCQDPDDAQGRIWFVDAGSGAERASYKVPRQIDGTCTMHNFNFLPLRDGRKVLVSSAYTAGTTVVDVDKLLAGATPSAAEIGFYQPSGGNTWSSYWYNGHIYANDINRGLDVFLLSDKARAGAQRLDHLNPQTQLAVLR